MEPCKAVLDKPLVPLLPNPPVTQLHQAVCVNNLTLVCFNQNSHQIQNELNCNDLKLVKKQSLYRVKKSVNLVCDKLKSPTLISNCNVHRRNHLCTCGRIRSEMPQLILFAHRTGVTVTKQVGVAVGHNIWI